MRPASLAVALVTALLTFSFGAWPGSGPKRASKATSTTGALRFGRSVGSPTNGRLIGGARLEATPYLRFTPAYASGDARWGLAPLVDAIDRAARAVRRKYPDSVTSVGHLSLFGGGDIDRHHSHESGRDADIGFFVRSKSGKVLLPNTFLSFKGDGTAIGAPGYYFDDARNWAFIEALLGDPHARITHIFVATHIRARLLAYAEKAGAPHSLRVRAAELMAQPKRVLPHDDHFHIRIACPARMAGCIEYPAAPARAKRGVTAGGRERAREGKGQASPRTRAVAASKPPSKGPTPPKAPSPVLATRPEEAEREKEPIDTSDLPALALPVGDVDGPT